MYPINLIVATFLYSKSPHPKTLTGTPYFEAIAVEGKIPVNDKSDKAFFKEITSNSTMFVTSKTLQDMLTYTTKENLLSRNRSIKYFTFSNKAVEGFEDSMVHVESKYEVLKTIWNAAQEGTVSIIGGSSLYDTILEDDLLLSKTNIFKVMFDLRKGFTPNNVALIRCIGVLNEKANKVIKKYTSKQGNKITIYTS